MNTVFKYNGTIISTPNLDKKLKRMKITINDIEIIDSPKNKQEEVIEYEDKTLYTFKNKITGETVISIYPDLDNLKRIINIDEYDRTITN